MKSYRKELSIYLPSRRGLVNLTGRVEQALQQSGIREGLVLVNSMDLTASVFMCPDESGLHQDVEVLLERNILWSHIITIPMSKMEMLI